jgi:hypothetical protein
MEIRLLVDTLGRHDAEVDALVGVAVLNRRVKNVSMR